MGLDNHRALWYGLVMSLYTYGLTGAQQEIIFDAHQRITEFSPPSNGTNRTVTSGRNITFVCRRSVAENNVFVEWYRNNQRVKTADVQYFNGRCRLKNQTLPRLSVEQTDCEDGQFKLRIREVDTSFEADWFCVVIRAQQVRYQSQYIGLHVQSLGAGRFIPDSGTPQLIVGVAGGGLMLLVVVITMCVLLRYRRTRNTDDGGRTSVQTEKDQESDGPLVMEDNPMYSSCDDENGVHAPKSGQECDVYSEVQKQPKTVPEFCGQDGVDGGSIYAKPDKRRTSACGGRSVLSRTSTLT
ncbi:uncharacterized protein LOC124286116 isoform X2 [Haliotis rubra]|uniref:uncharacterized protein LOC124286116 isoform X2 n=1 Tax=Haliotis rubra TaxID=36100 RepID=UPI001EE4EB48|nr:uncharacterized protein LOC124286116 isoform X2 [Haliotis rubra]